MKGRGLVWGLWAVVAVLCFVALFLPKHQPLPNFRTSIVLAAQLFSLYIGIRRWNSGEGIGLFIVHSLSASGIGAGLGMFVVGAVQSLPLFYGLGAKWSGVGIVMLVLLIRTLKKNDDQAQVMAQMDSESKAWASEFQTAANYDPEKAKGMALELKQRIDETLSQSRTTHLPSVPVLIGCLLMGLGAVAAACTVILNPEDKDAVRVAWVLVGLGLFFCGGAVYGLVARRRIRLAEAEDSATS